MMHAELCMTIVEQMSVIEGVCSAYSNTVTYQISQYIQEYRFVRMKITILSVPLMSWSKTVCILLCNYLNFQSFFSLTSSV